MYLLMFVIMMSNVPRATPYGISILQKRTLFAQDEKVIITIRVGNNSARELKAKYFPNILEPILLMQDGVEVKQNEDFAKKEMFESVEFIRMNGQIDRKVDLALLFPAIKKGGTFEVFFKNKFFNLTGKPIKISQYDLPDLQSVFRAKTSMGDIDIKLYPAEAPNHARNFAILVREGFYKDMIFHRVARGFVIQTGDPKGDGTGGSGFPLDLEWSPFVKHHPYAVGMARNEERDSADSQFYICLDANKSLNKDYTVFGKVVKGTEVVDQIGLVGTTGPYGSPPNKPFEDIHLYSIEILPPTP